MGVEQLSFVRIQFSLDEIQLFHARGAYSNGMTLEFCSVCSLSATLLLWIGLGTNVVCIT
jgi:hypothetical protein